MSSLEAFRRYKLDGALVHSRFVSAAAGQQAEATAPKAAAGSGVSDRDGAADGSTVPRAKPAGAAGGGTKGSAGSKPGKGGGGGGRKSSAARVKADKAAAAEEAAFRQHLSDFKTQGSQACSCQHCAGTGVRGLIECAIHILH